jgi:hypothetical protein
MEYSYGKIKKLADSLKNNGIEEAIVTAIMKDGEKIKQADKNVKKAEWFYNAIQVMDKQLKPKVRYKVRQDCACCLGGKRHEICVNTNKNFKNTRDRLKAVNEARLVFGHVVKKITDGKYEVSFFPEELEIKKCPCLKDLTKAMPITYCYCCGGHVKYHLETVLGKKLSVKVLETALSTKGKKGCRFELKEV